MKKKVLFPLIAVFLGRFFEMPWEHLASSFVREVVHVAESGAAKRESIFSTLPVMG